MARKTSYKQLRVYQAAMDAAMRIFQLSKRSSAEERYSLTDQIRGHRGPFVPISARAGGNDVIARLLLVN